MAAARSVTPVPPSQGQGKAAAVGRELSALFDGALHPVLVVRANRVVHANPAFRDLWGQSTPLRGKAVWDLCVPAQREQVEGWCRQPSPPHEWTLQLETPQPGTVTASVADLTLQGRQLRVLRIHDLPSSRRHTGAAAPAVPEHAMWRLLEDASLGVWLGDLDGRTVLVNAQAASLLGHTVEDLYAVTLADLLKLDGTPQQPRSHHLSFVRPDGVELQLEVAMAHFKGEDGTVAGTFALLRDVSSQAQMVREVRRSERRFRAMAETAPCAVAIMGAGTGPFFEVNNAATVMFGYRRDEWLAGAVRADALYANPADAREVLQRVRANGRLTEHRVTLKRRSGETFPSLLNVTRFFLDGEERLAVALLDLGALGQPTAPADPSWEVVPVVLDAVQSQLASLHGAARTAPTGAALAAPVAHAGHVLARLLRGLSMVGAVSQAPLQTATLDLPAVWAQVLSQEQPFLNGTNVTVELPAELNVVGDLRLLTVALRSVFHAVAGGGVAAVAVRSRMDEQQGRVTLVWQVEPANHGSNGHNHVPTPQDQAAARAVALAVARAVVARHGGSLWEEDEGSITCVSLPLPRPG